MRIEQTRRARHRQNEAVGFDNLIVDTVLVVAVAGIRGQVLERIVVIDKRYGLALEAIIPNKTFILQHAETVSATVVERLPDLFLQWEVECGTLEAALVIYAFDPRHNLG